RMLRSRMQGWLLFFKRGAIPLRQFRGGIVGALRKVEQCLIWLFGDAHRVVRQDEFAQLGLVKGGVWLNFCLSKSGRFWICVRIKDWRRRICVSGPETETADLLRVGLARDRIRQMRDSTRMRRCLPPGKSRHRQIKTAPEKMHRTAFAAET